MARCPECDGCTSQWDMGPCPHCKAWTGWRGGEPPVAADQPVEIWWPNGLRRVYERGDWIMWRNLKTDGSVRWRLPK